MISKVTDEILEEFYSKALLTYLSCIEKPENNFLSEEIGMGVSSICAEKGIINFRFNETNSKNFVIEIKLILLSDNGVELGYYLSILDEEHNEIDDFLVFY